MTGVTAVTESKSKVAPQVDESQAKKAAKSRKKVKKVILDGIAHVRSSFNNTMISISDIQGKVIAWETCAKCGYRGSRKSTPYAAGEAAQKVAQYVMENFGMKGVDVYVKGPGPGRESAIRGLRMAGLKVRIIIDKTGVPYNGPRAHKNVAFNGR